MQAQQGGMCSSYIGNNLHVDILCFDDRIRRRLVQTEGVVVVVQLSPLSLLGFVLGNCTCALSLLAHCAIVEGRDVMSVAGLRAKRGCRGCVERRGSPVCRQRVVGRVVVRCLGGRVGRLLVVDRVVGRRGRRFPLLVCMPCRAVCCCAGKAWLGWWWRRRVVVVVVVVVNDNDFFGQAILVEVGPVGVPPSIGRARRIHGRVWRRCRGDGRQLLGLASVGGRAPTVVCIRRAASVAVVHGIAYPSGPVGELGIGHVGLVGLVVRIELMMGREGSRGRRGSRHGCRQARRVRPVVVETLRLRQRRRCSPSARQPNGPLRREMGECARAGVSVLCACACCRHRGAAQKGRALSRQGLGWRSRAMRRASSGRWPRTPGHQRATDAS
jgi:hypothetical protein